MRLCSKCGAETADACKICGICGAAVDEVESADHPLEVPVEATIADLPFRPTPRQVPVGMPRRFSIGTMMILVTAFAVLFGFLKSIGAPPAGFAAISIFIGGVAACQAILFKGKRPRLASLVSGIVLSYLVGIVAMGIECFTNQGWYNIWDFTAMLFGVVLWAMFFGGPSGYAIGCMVAAIFLVRKEPDDAEPTVEQSAEHSP